MHTDVQYDVAYWEQPLPVCDLSLCRSVNTPKLYVSRTGMYTIYLMLKTGRIKNQWAFILKLEITVQIYIFYIK